MTTSMANRIWMQVITHHASFVPVLFHSNKRPSILEEPI